MTTYGMLIDVDRCTGCYNCFLSCRDEFCGNNYPPYSASQPSTGQFWMNVKEIERGSYPKMKVAYTPVPCLHCKNPACIKAALDGAAYLRKDGIVIIDPEKAKGQKAIASACPYRVIYWNEQLQIPQKCTFCAHLLDQGWKVPRCVEACPTNALVFGDLDDPASEIAKLKAVGGYDKLNPEYGLNPKVLYAALPKRFIAGEICLTDKPDECAHQVEVVLLQAGKTTGKTKTDVYGDFEFEGLEKDGDYTVQIKHKGYQSKTLNVRTKIDMNLGEIRLIPNK
jgi:Fe-S-cluster-containing dehydrogenase component